MPTSKIGIANRALDLLGASNITSFEENSVAARTISNAYDFVLKDFLGMHFWKFATKRAPLAMVVGTPAFEYSYQFALPADYVQVIRIDPAESVYAIEDNYLLTDQSAVSMKYVYFNTDVTKYSANFVEALACLLALRCCFKVTQNNSRDDKLSENFKAQLRQAKSFDSKQGTPQKFRDDIWIAARGDQQREPQVIIDGNINYGDFTYNP